MSETAAASRSWALVIAFVVLVLCVAGGTAWMRGMGESGAPAPVGFAAAPEMKTRPSTVSASPPTATVSPGSVASSPAAPGAVTSGAATSSAAAPGAVASGPSASSAAASSSVASNPAVPSPVAEPPRFDVVRVEPSGDTVVAGKGEPNAKMALLSQGVVVAETTADASGHFVVLPPALQPGDHALSLRQTPVAGAASTSAQSVTVLVPARGKGSVVVALAEPGQGTKVLSAPDAPAPPKAADPMASPVATAGPKSPAPTAPVVTADTKVAVRAVDLEHGDGFHASGIAAPGTPLQVYLNNSHIADVVANQDGAWAVTIRKGLAGGHYVVRADAGAKGGAVASRAEVPFDVPVDAASAMAAATPQPTPSVIAPSDTAASNTASATPPDARRQTLAATSGIGATASAENAVIDEIQTARVVTGDNLWNISLSRLGQATRYTQIYAANEKQIRDPNLIYPGQVLVLPR